MPNVIRVQVDNADELLDASMYGTGAIIRLQSADTEAGAYSNAGTAALVAGQDLFTIFHSAGLTSTWYRSRYENSGATLTSDWTAPFQANGTDTYASLDELVQRLDLPDTNEYALLEDILVAVSAQMDAETHRRFYRIPDVSGTVVRLYDGDGSSSMFFPEGIVSLTTVELADRTGGTYTTVPTSSWFLRPKYASASWPYTELDLDGYVFAEGYDTVRLTGVFGFASVPALVKEAVLELSARTYSESKTRHAGPAAGIAEYGTFSIPQFRPDAWHRALRHFGRVLM